ncbi:MAG TPA: MFS transporter, partial [Thermoanaerobaculia bacterium]|nr:MFS transporter [Thermoanaerobaculia bacterium]
MPRTEQRSTTMDYLRFVRDNRRFLAFGFLFGLCSSFGQTFFIALFGGELRAEFGLGHGEFGFVYSLGTLLSGLCLIWLGRVIDRVDLRAFGVLVALGLALACLLMAAAWSVPLLFAAFFALRLTGQGLMVHTSATSMARYFDAGRGKAMSIAALGLPAGEMLLPLPAVALIVAVGWRETWAAAGVALALALPPLCLWLLKGHGARHRALVERTDRGEAAAGAAGGEGRRQWSRREVLRDPRFYLILVAVMVPSFVITGLFFHQVHLAAAKGWSLAWLASCFTAYALASTAAALGLGPLVDRFG